MNKSEVIVEVLAEGGSITLTGIRRDRGWIFSRSVDESTMYDLIDEEPIIPKPAEAYSWNGALRLLDKYSWQTLHPSKVHSEFRERVWIAVQERLGVDDEKSSELEGWRDLCTDQGRRLL